MNGLESPDYRRLTMASLRAAEHATEAMSSWRQHLANLFVRTQISGVMTRDVFCVAPDVSVEALTTVLLERGLNAVLVIDRVGRVVGVLSGAEHEDIDPQ